METSIFKKTVLACLGLYAFAFCSLLQGQDSCEVKVEKVMGESVKTSSDPSDERIHSDPLVTLEEIKKLAKQRIEANWKEYHQPLGWEWGRRFRRPLLESRLNHFQNVNENGYNVFLMGRQGSDPFIPRLKNYIANLKASNPTTFEEHIDQTLRVVAGFKDNIERWEREAAAYDLNLKALQKLNEIHKEKKGRFDKEIIAELWIVREDGKYDTEIFSANRSEEILRALKKYEAKLADLIGGPQSKVHIEPPKLPDFGGQNNEHGIGRIVEMISGSVDQIIRNTYNMSRSGKLIRARYEYSIKLEELEIIYAHLRDYMLERIKDVHFINDFTGKGTQEGGILSYILSDVSHQLGPLNFKLRYILAGQTLNQDGDDLGALLLLRFIKGQENQQRGGISSQEFTPLELQVWNRFVEKSFKYEEVLNDYEYLLHGKGDPLALNIPKRKDGAYLERDEILAILRPLYLQKAPDASELSRFTLLRHKYLLEVELLVKNQEAFFHKIDENLKVLNEELSEETKKKIGLDKINKKWQLSSTIRKAENVTLAAVVGTSGIGGIGGLLYGVGEMVVYLPGLWTEIFATEESRIKTCINISQNEMVDEDLFARVSAVDVYEEIQDILEAHNLFKNTNRGPLLDYSQISEVLNRKKDPHFFECLYLFLAANYEKAFRLASVTGKADSFNVENFLHYIENDKDQKAYLKSMEQMFLGRMAWLALHAPVAEKDDIYNVLERNVVPLTSEHFDANKFLNEFRSKQGPSTRMGLGNGQENGDETQGNGQ